MAKDKGEEVVVDETLEEGDSDPRVYEIGFHLDPELPVEEVKKAYQTMRDLVGEKGAFVAEGEPQMTHLAYTISRHDTAGRRDFDSAYFSWIAYEATAPAHADILAAASSDKRIVRFIDLLTTKDAARHALEMHELMMKMPEPALDPETAAGAELDAALESVVI